jgi:hypothetical protein
VPTGTVDFITRIGRPGSSGSSSTTVQTRDRSASPEYVGGVSTQTKRNSQSATSSTSSVYARRSALRASSSGTCSSWNGTWPRQRVDLLRDDVADHDLVPELREARAGDEADPAGAEDAYLAHGINLLRRC